MEEFNQSLFLLINASTHPSTLLLNSAMLCAEALIFLIPGGLLLGWFRGGEQTRKLMLEAVACGIVGLSISMLFGVFWQHPRPFMIGLGTNFLAHSPDSSFPSDHLTLQWSVAFSFQLSAAPAVAQDWRDLELARPADGMGPDLPGRPFPARHAGRGNGCSA